MKKIIKILSSKSTQSTFKTIGISLFLLTIAVSAIIFTILQVKYYKAGNAAEPNPYNSSAYSIVFMEDNLFYFCKLETYNSEYIKCNDPYYLVRRSETGADGKKEEKVFVTKPSDEEVYQPEGSIYLAKQNIIYVAKVGDKSAVMEYISKQ